MGEWIPILIKGHKALYPGSPIPLSEGTWLKLYRASCYDLSYYRNLIKKPGGLYLGSLYGS